MLWWEVHVPWVHVVRSYCVLSSVKKEDPKARCQVGSKKKHSITNVKLIPVDKIGKQQKLGEQTEANSKTQEKYKIRMKNKVGWLEEHWQKY